MKRLVVIVLTLLVVACIGLYFFDQYWIHRYDSVIAREASHYQLDPDLVWSIVYEETYFRPGKRGRDGEIGLMQVKPIVVREWAGENGVAAVNADPNTLLLEPERNVQIGCWYLGKFDDEYRATPGREARMLAAYNAGDSRAIEWNRVAPGARPLTEQEFIARIDISSTRAYVSSILDRYHKLKATRNPSPATTALEPIPTAK